MRLLFKKRQKVDKKILIISPNNWHFNGGVIYLCPIFFLGVRSSVVEHLPFKQRVGGSRPPALTKQIKTLKQFKVFLYEQVLRLHIAIR